MSFLAFCQWLQDTAFSAAVRESTWGFPILAALHVLALAWFGAAILVRAPALEGTMRRWRIFGVSTLLVTGLLLFYVEPLKCYHSRSFWVKMSLLVLIAWVKRQPVVFALWLAVIFAARAIAYF